VGYGLENFLKPIVTKRLQLMRPPLKLELMVLDYASSRDLLGMQNNAIYVYAVMEG
jgi:hypothetical protein